MTRTQPPAEAERQTALEDLEILDTPPEPEFDRITRLALNLFEVPMAAISLIDENRQWFKSRIGLAAGDARRDWSFCSQMIPPNDVMVVTDAQRDARFASHPLVAGEPRVRFYAAAPLRSRDGCNLGALCILDTAPRPDLNAEQRAALSDLAALVMDACERRRLARRRKESEALEGASELYRIMAEMTPDAIITRDEEGAILSVNSAAERMFGYPREDLIGKPVTMLMAKPGQDPAALRAARRKTSHLEVMGLHKDGRQIPVSLSFGEFTRCGRRIFAAIARDETERHRAERERAATEQQYRTAVNNIQEVIFQTDGRGYWTFLNPAWTGITGFSIEESLGRSFLDFIHPEDRERGRELLQRLITGNHEYCRCEIRYLTKDGEFRWLEFWARPIFDPAGTAAGASGTLSDVTNRKQVEEELRAAKEEAERASKAKDEFLSRVSHELRTPMNAILGFAQLLDMDDLTPDQRSNMSRILKAGKHLLGLLNEILDISRIESGRIAIELEPVDPADLMKSAIDLVQPLLAERGITLRTAETPNLRVLADRQKLTQVFLNLLSNAVKYNRENGQIVLGYECINGDLRIRVTDTGNGISDELLKKLFQPFERLGAERTSVPGTGLGLALSKRLVELMRGSIGVESQPGSGSTFWIQLHRLEEPAAESAQEPRPSSEERHTASSTVLYIEDNLINIHLIESIMKRRADVRLISAMQGNLGLEMARIHAPDLILLDLHLPDLSGIQVLKRLQEDARTASIPVVVITADALPGTRRQLMEAGAYAYLNKPIDIKQFLSTVHPLLEKEIIR